MNLFGVRHAIKAIDIFLRLAVHLVQFLVPLHRAKGTDLENDSDLGVGEDLNAVKFGSKLQFGHVLLDGGRTRGRFPKSNAIVTHGGE